MAVRAEPITGDSLAELYLGITRRFYGHADRIVVVDDYVANEWSYIPHFYSEFYVFQYATSFTAAETLAARVIAGRAPGVIIGHPADPRRSQPPAFARRRRGLGAVAGAQLGDR